MKILKVTGTIRSNRINFRDVGKIKKSSTFPQKFLTRQDGAGLQAEAANPEGPASAEVSFTSVEQFFLPSLERVLKNFFR